MTLTIAWTLCVLGAAYCAGGLFTVGYFVAKWGRPTSLGVVVGFLAWPAMWAIERDAEGPDA